MRTSRPLAGAVVGALVLVVANVAFARFAGGSEWTDPAIFMSPFAAAFGAIAGAAVAALTRQPGQRRPDDRSRRRSGKRKYR
jgi:peptidoglycan/LPS O-acetylase OafA/YrhL